MQRLGRQFGQITLCLAQLGPLLSKWVPTGRQGILDYTGSPRLPCGHHRVCGLGPVRLRRSQRVALAAHGEHAPCMVEGCLDLPATLDKCANMPLEFGRSAELVEDAGHRNVDRPQLTHQRDGGVQLRLQLARGLVEGGTLIQRGAEGDRAEAPAPPPSSNSASWSTSRSGREACHAAWMASPARSSFPVPGAGRDPTVSTWCSFPEPFRSVARLPPKSRGFASLRCRRSALFERNLRISTVIGQIAPDC